MRNIKKLSELFLSPSHPAAPHLFSFPFALRYFFCYYIFMSSCRFGAHFAIRGGNRMFHKVFESWSASTTRSKLIISLMIVSIIPLLISQTILFYYYNHTVKEKIMASGVNSVEQTARVLDSWMQDYLDYVLSIISDDTIISATKELMIPDTPNKAIALSQVKREFSAFSSKKPEVAISLLLPDGNNIVFDNDSTRFTVNLWEGQAGLRNEIYSTAIGKAGCTITKTIPDRQFRGQVKNYFHIANKIVDQYTLQELGVIVVTVNEEAVSSLFAQSNEESAYSVVVSGEGDIISAQNKELIGLNTVQDCGALLDILQNPENGVILKDITRTVVPTLSGKRTPTCTVNEIGKAVALTGSVPAAQWYIVNIFSGSYFYSDITTIRNTYWVVSLITLGAIILVVIALSGSLTKSAKSIVAAMERAKGGDLDIQVDIKTKDEMSIVAQTFNEMMVKISSLTNNLREERDRTANAIKNEKDAEIKALTAQINPHFLYNTLDAINWSLIEKEEYEISRMITSLSSILRYSINNKIKIIPLSDEYEWLKKYIYLRQCANNTFNAVIDMDPHIAGCKIYKLLLQPIIENCIDHGFEGYISGGLIKIDFRSYDEDAIEIVIEDNGQGMPEEIVREVMDGSYSHESAHGLGLKNVLSRLHIYYGGDARFNVESTLGKGTTIRLLLPKL